MLKIWPYGRINFTMAINVEVTRTGNENNASILRRFTRKVQGSGVLPRVRSLRYELRNQSEYTKKKKTLKVLRRRAEVAELIKLGKLQEKTKR